LQSIGEQLLREGAHVVAYDPKGMHKARAIKAIADAEFASSAWKRSLMPKR